MIVLTIRAPIPSRRKSNDLSSAHEEMMKTVTRRRLRTFTYGMADDGSKISRHAHWLSSVYIDTQDIVTNSLLLARSVVCT